MTLRKTILAAAITLLATSGSAVGQEWNFDDESKIAQGKIQLSTPSGAPMMFSAGQGLATSNTVISGGGGALLGQIVTTPLTAPQFYAANELEPADWRSNADVDNGSVDITGTALAEATGSNLLNIAATGSRGNLVGIVQITNRGDITNIEGSFANNNTINVPADHYCIMNGQSPVRVLLFSYYESLVYSYTVNDKCEVQAVYTRVMGHNNAGPAYSGPKIPTGTVNIYKKGSVQSPITNSSFFIRVN